VKTDGGHAQISWWEHDAARDVEFEVALQVVGVVGVLAEHDPWLTCMCGVAFITQSDLGVDRLTD
jgi:hypothetical protein